MRGLIRIIIVFVFIGCISCEKKKYPESSVENDAVFFVHGTLDYNPLSLVAGENEYYMYSSYALDSNSVYNFSGAFKTLNCTDCRKTLEFRIRDLKAAPGGVPNPTDSSLKIGSYLFLDRTNDVVHSVSFQGSYKSPNMNGSKVHWDFGDGTSSGTLDPTHIYQRPGKYTVCLTLNDNNGCQGSVCNEINVGKDACNASVESVIMGDRILQFSASVFGRAPFKYRWNFGDGTGSEVASPLHTYKYIGSYPVTLTLTDADNRTVVSNHHIITNKDAYSCVPNTKVLGLNSSAPFNTAGVVLSWTDEHGVTYTTDRTPQLVTSFFMIDKIEDFTPNEKSQKTKKLHVTFSCVMSDGKKSIPFTNAQAVICVAVP